MKEKKGKKRKREEWKEKKKEKERKGWRNNIKKNPWKTYLLQLWNSTYHNPSDLFWDNYRLQRHVYKT
jgi:hypothetical protein